MWSELSTIIGELSTKSGVECSFVVQAWFNKWVGNGRQKFVRMGVCNRGLSLIQMVVYLLKGTGIMEGKARVSRQGEELVVHIPAEIVRELDIKDGSVVDIATSGGGLLIREGLPDIREMLEQITPETLHDEFDFGA